MALIIKPYAKRERTHQITFKDASLTKQSFKDETDINQIMEKFQKTGAIEHRNEHQPQYGFATEQNFQDAMNLVTEAQNMFDDLPSSIRAKFHNDPGSFLDFVQDPDNLSEMADMGLLTPEATHNLSLQGENAAAGQSKPSNQPKGSESDLPSNDSNPNGEATTAPNS